MFLCFPAPLLIHPILVLPQIRIDMDLGCPQISIFTQIPFLLYWASGFALLSREFAINFIGPMTSYDGL